MLPDPASFPRRILLAVAGLSPQVVTETLWALARASAPFVPSEIHLVTTREGARRAELMLGDSDERPGALAELGRELSILGLPARLRPEHIHVVARADGTWLDDIATAEDNAAAADTITELVREFTADDASALHVSLAGGRKTMGFFAGYALSLFGRPQDRLSHVLVTTALQSHPLFFFPPSRPRVLSAHDGAPISTAEARLTLADIPFVRLRAGLRPADLRRPGGYADAVAAVQRAFAAPSLRLEPRAGRAVAAGIELRLPPSLFGLLLWFARRRLADGEGLIDWRAEPPEELLACIGEIPAAAGRDAVAAARRATAADGWSDYFAEKKARLNKVVASRLGPAAPAYCIETVGRRPRSLYRLATPAEAITVLVETRPGETPGSMIHP